MRAVRRSGGAESAAGPVTICAMSTLLRHRGAHGGAALAAATLIVLALGAPRADAVIGGTTRTWVSGIGDDANPCSRTAPCKTFAGAISKTADGGEIDALDSAGFGAVTITIPITIDASNVEGGVLNALVNGININAPGDDVVLRGLDINGSATATGACKASGLNGIIVRDAASVRIEDSTIENQSAAGIAITPTTTDPRVFVSNTHITNNCVNGVKVAPTGGHKPWVMVTGSSIFNSGTALSVGDGVSSWLQGSTITGNVVGLEHTGSGTIDSYADNVISGNATDGAATTQRTLKGDAGATGPAGTNGVPGMAGATGPAAFKLLVVPVATALRAKAGSKVKVKYVATTAAKATLTVTKGTKKVATVTGAVSSGANTITWTSKTKGKRVAKGSYALALRVVGADGQVATTKATVKLS
jgi:hypothetical protein